MQETELDHPIRLLLRQSRRCDCKNVVLLVLRTKYHDNTLWQVICFQAGGKTSVERQRKIFDVAISLSSWSPPFFFSGPTIRHLGSFSVVDGWVGSPEPANSLGVSDWETSLEHDIASKTEWYNCE